MKDEPRWRGEGFSSTEHTLLFSLRFFVPKGGRRMEAGGGRYGGRDGGPGGGDDRLQSGDGCLAQALLFRPQMPLPSPLWPSIHPSMGRIQYLKKLEEL